MSTVASDLPGVSGATREAPLRFVTAASLFDGHDAAINIMRRLIQARGAEVIHLGHNRSVDDIVRAAIQEDADGIAISSYQGGHNEFFRYMMDRLRESGAGHIKVFGGGGGTITPEEIAALMEYGVERIYHPHDGMELGLEAMIEDLVARTSSGRRVSGAPRTVELGTRRTSRRRSLPLKKAYSVTPSCPQYARNGKCRRDRFRSSALPEREVQEKAALRMKY